MKRCTQVCVPLAMALAVALPLAGETAKFIRLEVDRQATSDLCVLVHTRNELRATLQALGYRGDSLPQIAWGQKGAAVITLRGTGFVPSEYVPVSAQRPGVGVLYRGADAAHQKSVYVMEIDSASAAGIGCSVNASAQVVTVTPPSPSSVYSTKGGVTSTTSVPPRVETTR